MNSEGGDLLIGVYDNGTISGIEKDNLKNTDAFLHCLHSGIHDHLGIEAAKNLTITFHKLEKKTVCWVKCKKSDTPLFYDQEEFIIKVGNTTRELLGLEMLNYIVKGRFDRSKLFV